MHIYGGLRESGQDPVAQLRIDFRGIHGEVLVRPAGLHLEAALPAAVQCGPVVQNGLGQGFEVVVIGQLHHGANADDAENMLQSLYGLVIIVVFGLHVHINASPLPGHAEFSLHMLQLHADVVHQGVFKNIAVLALGADLGIFDQKALILHKTPYK